MSNNEELKKLRFYVFGSGLSVTEVKTRVHWFSKPIVIAIGFSALIFTTPIGYIISGLCWIGVT